MKKLWPEAVFIFLSVIVFLSFPSKHEKYGMPEEEEVIASPLFFGIPADSFNIVGGKIQPNQNLGSLLATFGVSMAKIDKLARNSVEVFDVRKIRAGNDYYILQRRDSSNTAHYFVYETNNKINYYVFDLTDSLHCIPGQRDVTIISKTAWGVIESSLWNSLKNNNLNMNLADELSRIYAWSIDFFGIQKGDRFRLYYDEKFVDSLSVGIEAIYAVEFEHMNKPFFAYRYEQDSISDYFDNEGQSLRKAFLKAPLTYSRISSHFSDGRLHPILKIRRPHHGVDYAAPAGTPVVSIGEGVVQTRAYQAGGAGNYVRIKHNSVYTTAYMHLKSFAPGITQGSRVKQGQEIGYVGSTGLSTGPHLDFRVYKNGTPIDPLSMESPPSEPVKPENMQSFHQLRDSLNQFLFSINWNVKDEVLP
ncbi:MAG: peptidoglycan DD-metalloendopeptidase family protein [Prolixibacteraceae bacterium]|nr:peptidoglycan DD-metalloendopeptidase family protein [Prolixibacteraceae bacterium]